MGAGGPAVPYISAGGPPAVRQRRLLHGTDFCTQQAPLCIQCGFGARAVHGTCV